MNRNSTAFLTRRHFKYIGIITVFILISLHLAPKSFAAVDNLFPEPNQFADADVATLGAGTYSGIEAPVSEFEISTKALYTGKIKVTVLNACQDRTAGSPGAKARIIGQKDWKNCNNNDDIVFDDVSMGSPEERYDDQIKSVILEVRKINGEGHQPFKVKASTLSPGADADVSVSYRGDPDVNSTEFSAYGGGAFALWPDPTVPFRFKPTCDYKEGDPVYLKWRDADVGTSIEEGGVSWKLYEKEPGKPEIVKDSASGSQLGGNQKTKVWRKNSGGLKLNPKATYRWVWFGLDGINALQVRVPFSENTYKLNIDCNDPPTGEIKGVGCNFIRGWAFDEDKPNFNVQYRIYINGRSSPIASGTADNNNYKDGHGFYENIDLKSYFTPKQKRTFKLYGRNISPDGQIAPWRIPPHDSQLLDTFSVTINGSKCGTGELPDDEPPEFDFDVDCDSVRIKDLKDVNDVNDRGVRYIITFWQDRDSNGDQANAYHKVDARGTNDITINYPAPTQNKGWRVDIYVVNIKPNGSDSGFEPINQYRPNNKAGPCYDVTCEVKIIENVPGSPANGVRSNQGFNIEVNLNNKGPARINNTDFGVTFYNDSPDNGGWTWGRPSREFIHLTPGIHELTAPDDISSRHIAFYPDYFGRFGIGPACPVNVITYDHFDLTVTATATLTRDNSDNREDPDNAHYEGRGNHADVPPKYSDGIYVDYTANSRRTPYGGSQITVDSKSGNGKTKELYSHNYTIPSADRNAGDQYCLDFIVHQASGWIGPNNRADNSDIFDSVAKTAPRGCDRVENKPYVRAYGADVIAGSNFKNGEICNSNGNREILTYRSSTAGKSGSGAQFAAMAMGQISGFTSASIRTSEPVVPVGLTFSNTTGGDGGFFAGGVVCSTDFYATTQRDDITTRNTNNLDLATITEDNKQTLINPSGKLNITNSAGGQSFSKKHTVYVNGDVIINNNVVYPGLGPSFTLVVKGNIYIDKSVSQLDGLYIAQPGSGNSGNIYTCTNGGGLYVNNTAELWNNCRSRLVVNGAFIAQDVKLIRILNSLRDSEAGELAGQSKAAEIFNFSPEIYLFPPVFKDLPDSIYKFITTLPPVL